MFATPALQPARVVAMDVYTGRSSKSSPQHSTVDLGSGTAPFRAKRRRKCETGMQPRGRKPWMRLCLDAADQQRQPDLTHDREKPEHEFPDASAMHTACRTRAAGHDTCFPAEQGTIFSASTARPLHPVAARHLHMLVALGTPECPRGRKAFSDLSPRASRSKNATCSQLRIGETRT
jgi:hypothetical protein